MRPAVAGLPLIVGIFVDRCNTGDGVQVKARNVYWIDAEVRMAMGDEYIIYFPDNPDFCRLKPEECVKKPDEIRKRCSCPEDMRPCQEEMPDPPKLRPTMAPDDDETVVREYNEDPDIYVLLVIPATIGLCFFCVAAYVVGNNFNREVEVGLRHAKQEALFQRAAKKMKRDAFRVTGGFPKQPGSRPKSVQPLTIDAKTREEVFSSTMRPLAGTGGWVFAGEDSIFRTHGAQDQNQGALGMHQTAHSQTSWRTPSRHPDQRMSLGRLTGSAWRPPDVAVNDREVQSRATGRHSMSSSSVQIGGRRSDDAWSPTKANKAAMKALAPNRQSFSWAQLPRPRS